MTELAITEAIRAAGSVTRLQEIQQLQQLQQMEQVQAVADPEAVAAFQAAMSPQAPTDIPFAHQVAETFNMAQDNRQGLLHRIKALTDLGRVEGPSLAALTELQYEVATLSFQHEVVTNVAKKASDAVSTLVKNG